VALLQDGLAAPPPTDAVDADLFELACAVQDAVGGEWSGETLRQAARSWGYPAD
jgi:hypothetical protein